ncbi:MAG: cupin domain-containing protein [Anaerolineae bacterium]|jgi:mannose-6-phosphate isomerase-like protein (cupin superfamily)
MRVEQPNPTVDKGWYVGPWNSDLAVSIGYANEGVDEPHLHLHLTEIYMVARGTSKLKVEQETVCLEAGDVIVVEPGEAHTFLSASSDYFHFVAHVPGPTGSEAKRDKRHTPRSRLGL